jgi:hypothetical protein
MSTKPRQPKRQPAAPPAKVNISALSRQLGVSRESLRKWRLEGVDLSKPAQLAERVARMHTGPAGSEPMKSERLRKLRADAGIAEHELAKRRGEVLDAGTVQELFVGLVMNCLAQFKRGPSQLPGLLEGMSAPQMKTALLDFRDEQILAVRSQMEGVFSQLGATLPEDSDL